MKKNIFLILIFFAVLLSAQSTIVEYARTDSYGSYHREILYFDDVESVYINYIDGKDVPIDDIFNKYNINRGGFNYRALNDFNKYIHIGPTMTSGFTNYMFVDDKPLIEWKLANESKKVLGYVCQKAVGDFRGRTWEVWFTKDIQSNLGPWKLDGLPGLILEAHTKDQAFNFEAIKVIKNSSHQIPKPIKTFITNYKNEDKRKYEDYVKELDDYKYQFYLQRIANQPKGTLTSERPDSRKLMKEYIYEWETPKTQK